MTSAMPVQFSNQMSYEATQMKAGQFIGLMCSRERNDEWKKCLWGVVERWIEDMIVTLAGQSQRLSHMSWTEFSLKAQLLRALTGMAEAMDSNLVEDTWNFSGAYMRQSLRLPTSVRIISSIHRFYQRILLPWSRSDSLRQNVYIYVSSNYQYYYLTW